MYQYMEAAELGSAEGLTELRCDERGCNQLYQSDGHFSPEEIREEAEETDGWHYDGNRDLCSMDSEEGWLW